MRINQPQNQEAAVAFLQGIGELEGVHAVLQRVGECEQAVLGRFDGFEGLDCGFVAECGGAEDGGEGAVLCRVLVFFVEVCFDAEGDGGVGTIGDGVVVD